MTPRPPLSVIVPFAGTEAELQALLEALQRVQTRAGDELIVAHNRLAPGQERRRGAIVVHGAAGIRSPGYARNRGAAVAQGRWLVFLDADTRPQPDVLDALFAPPPADRTALLAGEIVDVPRSAGVAGAHAQARRHLSQAVTLGRGRFSYAQSANLAVRADAFAAAGGFDATARAGEDADLCLRLQQAGWSLEVRPHAVVQHVGRATVAARLRQLAVHGAGAAWVDRRHPGALPATPPAALARRVGHHARAGVRALARGERQEAAFQGLDLLGALAYELGRLLPNRARGVKGSRR